jgi:hypothetical protein
MREAIYNPGCCGKTFLSDRVLWCRLRRNRHSHIGTNFCTRMSFALIPQSVLPEVGFSEAVRFAEDEARFRLF